MLHNFQLLQLFRVCQGFNEMVSRAFSEPKNSEEFLALSDYMLYANTTFMQEMIQTVKDLSLVACNISQYTVLPQDFWKALTTSIMWIQDVTPIFFKYSTIYDIGKTRAEETLTNVINKFIYDLDKFAPYLVFLDRIDDINKIHDYKLVIKRNYGI